MGLWFLTLMLRMWLSVRWLKPHDTILRLRSGEITFKLGNITVILSTISLSSERDTTTSLAWPGNQPHQLLIKSSTHLVIGQHKNHVKCKETPSQLHVIMWRLTLGQAEILISYPWGYWQSPVGHIQSKPSVRSLSKIKVTVSKINLYSFLVKFVFFLFSISKWYRTNNNWSIETQFGSVCIEKIDEPCEILSKSFSFSNNVVEIDGKLSAFWLPPITFLRTDFTG